MHGIAVEAIDWRDMSRSEASIRKELRDKKTFRTVPGIVERYAEPCVTMCDYDRRVIHPMERVWRLSRLIQAVPLWVQFRRTARGWHMVIEWDHAFSHAETVAIQAILGSDPYREAFNLARIRGIKNDPSHVLLSDGLSRWNLLFKEKLK
jgi:hypothetical protein